MPKIAFSTSYCESWVKNGRTRNEYAGDMAVLFLGDKKKSPGAFFPLPAILRGVLSIPMAQVDNAPVITGT